ncbi:MAG: 2-amino-4-hydroxy-6-hydroxymethyldihydropteridine diphosphokinase [Pseudomonadota bacterium]
MNTLSGKNALVAFGGNLAPETGSITENLGLALSKLLDCNQIQLIARSRWWRTPAYPPGSGPDFVNGAARLSTTLCASALLAELHRIESALGREREGRWLPRVCDLDLLALDDEVWPDRPTLAAWIALDPAAAQKLAPPHLVLPHPRMQERAFVLLPLAEIAPDWRHPTLGKTVTELLAALSQSARQDAYPLDGEGTE